MLELYGVQDNIVCLSNWFGLRFYKSLEDEIIDIL